MGYRVLAVDDDTEILDAYRRVFEPQATPGQALRQALRIAAPEQEDVTFDLVTASQGEEGARLFKEAHEAGQGFAVVYLDMRMPPGWDGLQTAEAIREVDPDAFIVIVSAYNDRTIEELRLRLGPRFMTIRKPFSRQELQQTAYTLSTSWDRSRRCSGLQAGLSSLQAPAQALRQALSAGVDVEAAARALLAAVDAAGSRKA